MRRYGWLAGLIWAVLGGGLAAWPLPPPLETAHLLGKGLPAGAPPVPLTDELYALGWSRSNALATLERRSEGDRYLVRIRVTDLVEDRLLFEETWADWGTEDQKAAWWDLHFPQVEEVFSRFSLAPTSWQLGVFPLILDNEFYTLALRTYPSSRDPEWIERLEVLAHSTGRGLKVVKDAWGYWRWATLVGFLPSPFENRVAVVLLVQPSGWQGPSAPLRFLVSGLSLKAGFSKP